MSTTVSKALQIMALFENRVEVGVMEASEELGLTPSNTSRLLSTLADQGWVVVDPVSRRYRLGMRVLSLAAQYYSQQDLGRLARPILERLRDVTGETAVLQIRMGNQRVCLEQVPSLHVVRRVVQVGEPYELAVGSSGKVLLAYMPDHEREKVLEESFERAQRVAAKRRTLTSLRQELVKIRERGFAVSVDEHIQGSCGIAAPVFDYRGLNVAAIGVSGPTSRLERQKREAFIPIVMEAARDLSEILGYTKASGGSAPR